MNSQIVHEVDMYFVSEKDNFIFVYAYNLVRL